MKRASKSRRGQVIVVCPKHGIRDRKEESTKGCAWFIPCLPKRAYLTDGLGPKKAKTCLIKTRSLHLRRLRMNEGQLFHHALYGRVADDSVGMCRGRTDRPIRRIEQLPV